MMLDIGLRYITIDTRIVIFTPDLAAAYFTETGKTVQSAMGIGRSKWPAARERRLLSLHRAGLIKGCGTLKTAARI
jgi:hypothetical protein